MKPAAPVAITTAHTSGAPTWWTAKPAGTLVWLALPPPKRSRSAYGILDQQQFVAVPTPPSAPHARPSLHLHLQSHPRPRPRRKAAARNVAQTRKIRLAPPSNALAIRSVCAATAGAAVANGAQPLPGLLTNAPVARSVFVANAKVAVAAAAAPSRAGAQSRGNTAAATRISTRSTRQPRARSRPARPTGSARACLMLVATAKVHM